ncbi:hypothetical protein Rxycam_02153 [Rubrobacter xylanophilus DSM 9941]|nr:hypothetical protein Rxycam_02153 [Rubrobacter xylanophilus DSM 9941]
MVSKLLLPFPLLSDPRGELARRCGLWNERERVAVPALVLVDRSATVRYLYAGRDFADRPGDEDVFAAARELEGGAPPEDEPEVVATPADAGASTRPARTPQRLEDLLVYYRGVYFATVALGGRFEGWGEPGRRALGEVIRYRKLIEGHREAARETLKLREES